MAKFPRKLISKVQYYHLLVLGILILVAAVSCRASEGGAQVTPELELTETAASVEEALQVSPTAEMAEAEAEPKQVDECLACHTDKQELIDTADPVVVVAAENSGEG